MVSEILALLGIGSLIGRWRRLIEILAQKAIQRADFGGDRFAMVEAGQVIGLGNGGLEDIRNFLTLQVEVFQRRRESVTPAVVLVGAGTHFLIVAFRFAAGAIVLGRSAGIDGILRRIMGATRQGQGRQAQTGIEDTHCDRAFSPYRHACPPCRLRP